MSFSFIEFYERERAWEHFSDGRIMNDMAFAMGERIGDEICHQMLGSAFKPGTCGAYGQNPPEGVYAVTSFLRGEWS